MNDFIFTSKGAIYRLNDNGKWAWLEDIIPMLRGECNPYKGTPYGPYQALAGYPMVEGRSMNDKLGVGEVWKQVRPGWCPHQDCQFKRRATDAICVGQLLEPEPHDGDENTHRICLNGVADNGGVFDLQINRSDVGWFRWLFEAIFPTAAPEEEA